MWHNIPLVFLVVISVAGCAYVPESRTNHITGNANELRPRIENGAVAVVAAPINLVPNVLSNYIVGLYPGKVWPIQYLFWPISGLVWGIQDTFRGYPFWSPSALYE